MMKLLTTYICEKEVIKNTIITFRIGFEKGDMFELYRYSRQGNIKIVIILLAHGSDINVKTNYGHTPLHWAIRCGQKETVELLISCGAILNEDTLYYAIIRNQPEIAKILLDNGVAVNDKNEYGQTPLHIASKINFKDIVDVLLQYGANINAKNGKGKTPLHIAAENSYKEIVEILLSRGADMDEKDDEGKTPYDLTASVEIKSLLAEHKLVKS